MFQENPIPEPLSFNAQWHFWHTGYQMSKKVQIFPQVRPHYSFLSVFIFIDTSLVRRHRVIAQGQP